MVRLTAALVHLMDNDIRSLLEDGIALGFLGSDADLDTLRLVLLSSLCRTWHAICCAAAAAATLSLIVYPAFYCRQACS